MVAQTYSQLSQSCSLVLPLTLRQTPWTPNGALSTWPLYDYKVTCPGSVEYVLLARMYDTT